MTVGGTRWEFDGFILGAGSTSGTRLVVGIWARSPFGAFVDVMAETSNGHRVLLAPDDEIAHFVETTYAFDEVRVETVRLRRIPNEISVTSDSLRLRAGLGRRTALGQLLTVVPRPLATNRIVAAGLDPIARRVLPGVRTYGSAGEGRREWYAALDEVRVTSMAAVLDDLDLGSLAAVRPPVRFGFGSVPAQPSLVRVISTVVQIATVEV